MDSTLLQALLSGAARQICIELVDTGTVISSGISSNSLALKRILCQSEDLTFGECNASMFQVEVSDISDISGQEIAVYMNVSGVVSPVYLFRGFVDSAKVTPNRKARNIIAYDSLYYHADDDVTSWYESQFIATQKQEYRGEWDYETTYIYPVVVKYGDQYYRYLCSETDITAVTEDDLRSIVTLSEYMVGKTPDVLAANTDVSAFIQLLEKYSPLEYSTVTLRNFRNSLFSYVGITQVSTTLINDGISVRHVDMEEITFSEIVRQICEINGVFGQITPEGKFQYISLGHDSLDYTGNVEALNSYYEEYETTVISAIRFFDSTKAYADVYGSGRNYWDITENILLRGMPDNELSAMAAALLQKVSSAVYTPISVSAKISIPLLGGETVEFTTPENEHIVSYALDSELSGAQLFSQLIVSTGNQKRKTSKGTEKTIISYLAASNAATQTTQQQAAEDLVSIKRQTIVQNLVEYALSSSTSTAPVSGWSVSAPDWTPGMYMWQRTTVLYGDGTSEQTVTCIAGAQGQSGKDAVLLRIDSSRGTLFKNNAVSTVLSVTIFHGETKITTRSQLIAEFGAGAYLQWYWQRYGETTWSQISQADSRLSDGGFNFTITADDVDTKVSFQCDVCYS